MADELGAGNSAQPTRRFLEALASKQLIPPERFVASVEFGNEVMSGSGTTWVSDYEVAVTPR